MIDLETIHNEVHRITHLAAKLLEFDRERNKIVEQIILADANLRDMAQKLGNKKEG